MPSFDAALAMAKPFYVRISTGFAGYERLAARRESACICPIN
jgi:hypothetical protein